MKGMITCNNMDEFHMPYAKWKSRLGKLNVNEILGKKKKKNYQSTKQSTVCQSLQIEARETI